MSNKPLKISEEASVQMPFKTVASLTQSALNKNRINAKRFRS
jgi:hypothetical protein